MVNIVIMSLPIQIIWITVLVLGGVPCETWWTMPFFMSMVSLWILSMFAGVFSLSDWLLR